MRRGWLFVSIGLCIAVVSTLWADEDDPTRFRISYRKSESSPWTFYADERNEEKAHTIANKLVSIGYESQVVPVSSGTPQPPKPTPPPSRPRAPFMSNQPQPTVASVGGPGGGGGGGGGGGHKYFPTPHPTPFPTREPPPNNLWGFNLGVLGGWGWGWALGPALTPPRPPPRQEVVQQRQFNAPVHPTRLN